MFRNIQIYMGDAAPGETAVERTGDERILRQIILCGRSDLHLACELYCQLVKQTHRCMDAENEVRKILAVVFCFVDVVSQQSARSALLPERSRRSQKVASTP